MTEHDERLAPPESPVGIQQRIRKRERELVEAQAKREAPDEAQEARRWKRFKAKVRREQEQNAQQRQRDAETVAAMSPEAKAEHYAAQQARSVERVTGDAPRLAPRRMMALEDIRRDDAQAANRQREADEQRAGIPRLEAEHAQRLQKIRDTADAELRELEQRRQATMARRRRKEDEETERHHDALRAARESLQEASA